MGDERECTELGQMETAPFPCSAQFSVEAKRNSGLFLFRSTRSELCCYLCNLNISLSWYRGEKVDL